jgi:diguanylate cyclase (GGDEF)-like protein/PAS domain S-box-containing protein
MPSTDSLNKPSIFLIDDDANVLLIGKKSLEKNGFLVHVFSNGREALTSLETIKVDLILSDVMMPELDGFTFCDLLRRSKYTTPIIMMTGLNDFESIEKAYAVGATDFAIKPVNWSILSHQIRYILRASEVLESLKATINLLQISKKQLSDVQRLAHLGSWVWNVDTDVMEWSEEAKSIFDFKIDRKPVTLSSFFRYVHPDDLNRVKQIFHQGLENKNNLSSESRIILDGDTRHIFIEIHVEGNFKKTIHFLKGIIQDITEQKLAQQQIEHLLHYDKLTGLPNRLSFDKYLEEAIEYSNIQKTYLGVLFLDIDLFKRINETKGYAYGNKLLKEFSLRLVNIFQNYLNRIHLNDSYYLSGMLASFGGDKFAIILPNLVKSTDASDIAQTIINSCTEIILEEDLLTVSIGISIFPFDSDKAELLTQHADIALNYAKRQGKNNFIFFSKPLNDAAMQRMSLEYGLHHALKKNELEVYFQAKFNMEKNLSGAEALLNWRSSAHGTISPADFIPIAEETGLINSIGYFVIQSVCAQLRQWIDMGIPPFKIAINISGVQLKDKNLLESIIKIVDSYQLPHALLEFEITESMLMDSIENSIITLEKFTESGFSIAIDDFGTGYSSLSYLRRFSIGRLKIDKSFIVDITSNRDNKAIVNAVIAISHHLGFQVTAEGVETEEHFQFLKEINCDEVQGFLLAKPLPSDDFKNKILRFEAGALSSIMPEEKKK